MNNAGQQRINQGDRHGVAKKAAVPAKSSVQATVTLKHLAASLADNHDLPKGQAEAVLGDLVALATKHRVRLAQPN
jgi:DNA-binding protein HU-beta